MTPFRAWQHTVGRTLGWLLLCTLAGLPFGLGWPALAIAAVLALGWHGRRMHRLLARSASPRWLPGPDGWGVWAQLEANLSRRERLRRGRSRRLLQALAAFRRAAAALPDAVVALNGSDHAILWFNEAAVRLLGLHYPADIGARFTQLVRSPQVLDWLRAGAPSALMDLPSPADEAIRLSLRLIDDGTGQALLIARDITRLTQLEQMRRDFVANVSHELRTPLTVVHGYLDMMDADQQPEWAPLIEEMRRQSQRMAQIVEDLLALSRLEARQHLEEEPVAMVPLLSTLAREAQALSQGRHAISVDDQAGIDMTGSLKELHSAFSNLVANAVRYTPAGGRVSVRWRRDTDGSLLLEVEDTGHGIPAQHLPRLTERFYRVSSSRSRESGGTGLGLAIVKHVLHLHQARLEIESAAGKGSTFRCRFAASRGAAREGADATA